MKPSRGSCKPGPSHAYIRLLQGKINAHTYCEIVRRAIRMEVKPRTLLATGLLER